MRMHRARIGILVATAIGFALPGFAQTTTYAPSGGVSSPILTCPFECKPGAVVQGEATFDEITTLQLANHGQVTRPARVLIFDGRSIAVAVTEVSLAPRDLDEINICHTLTAASISPPPAGLIEVVLPDELGATGPSGLVGWVKMLNGKFFANVPEPFSGRVDANGRAECQAAPVPSVASTTSVLAAAASAPVVTATLVESTADNSVPDLAPVASSFCTQLRIQNLGPQPAPASTARATYLGFVSHTLATPGLAPGAFVDLSFPNPPPACTDQTCQVLYEVDVLNNVVESNEANNTRNDSC